VFISKNINEKPNFTAKYLRYFNDLVETALFKCFIFKTGTKQECIEFQKKKRLTTLPEKLQNNGRV
jgi:hypothetical protein